MHKPVTHTSWCVLLLWRSCGRAVCLATGVQCCGTPRARRALLLRWHPFAALRRMWHPQEPVGATHVRATCVYAALTDKRCSSCPIRVAIPRAASRRAPRAVCAGQETRSSHSRVRTNHAAALCPHHSQCAWHPLAAVWWWRMGLGGCAGENFENFEKYANFGQVVVRCRSQLGIDRNCSIFFLRERKKHKCDELRHPERHRPPRATQKDCFSKECLTDLKCNQRCTRRKANGLGHVVVEPWFPWFPTVHRTGVRPAAAASASQRSWSAILVGGEVG